MFHALLFSTPIYDNSVASWTMALLVASATTAGLRLGNRAVRARLKHIAPRTETLLDDLLLDILQRTRLFFELSIGALLGNMWLTLPAPAESWLHGAMVLAVVVQLMLWANGVVHYGVVVLVERRAGPEDVAQQSGRNLMRALGVGVIWTLVALMGLDNVGVDVSTLITGLGVTGLAVGLAGQQIGSDLFASAAILLDRSILVGDFLIVDGVYLGTVERIGILKTHLRSLGGEKIIFANSDLAKSRVRNFRTLSERRVRFRFTLQSTTHSDDLVGLRNDVAAFVAQQPRARLDRAHWASFGEHGFEFEVVYYVQSNAYNDYMDLQQTINLAVLRLVEARGVKLAVGWAVRTQPAEV